MTVLALPPAWRARLAAAADAPPLRPRVPLWCGARRIGTVEPDLFARAGLQGGPLVRTAEAGWRLGDGEPTQVLAGIADTLRATGLAHTWRHEQLAVRGEDGVAIATVERGVARALGLATDAVHLTALAPDGSVWVQQRAHDKPTDPGKWDTLVGGLVPAGESLDEALARETWEEAGLRPAQLQALRRGGRVTIRRPLPEQAHGYVVEVLHWSTCTLPEGVVPENQDGEVAGFRRMAGAELQALLEVDEFTVDAALVLLAAHGDGAVRA
ncbi:MAG: NUDIX domain-containing protein [Pseudacidovorax sp.]|nr:NUDIX domain-containing protein [Pseudacidovorax sp.]